MIKLLESSHNLPDGTSDNFTPYQPKSQQIYVHKKVDESIVASLPFEVEGLEETIFVGIYEFTLGKQLLSVQILSRHSREVVAMSQQGKYFSALLAILPEGQYQLVIRNDVKAGANSKTQAPIEFLLDVIRQQVPNDEEYMDHYLEAMMVCSVPEAPKNGLTQAGYIHPLGGYQL